jgi:hypothetical protein
MQLFTAVRSNGICDGFTLYCCVAVSVIGLYLWPTYFFVGRPRAIQSLNGACKRMIYIALGLAADCLVLLRSVSMSSEISRLLLSPQPFGLWLAVQLPRTRGPGELTLLPLNTCGSGLAAHSRCLLLTTSVLYIRSSSIPQLSFLIKEDILGECFRIS